MSAGSSSQVGANKVALRVADLDFREDDGCAAGFVF